MTTIEMEGGRRLNGEITLQGSKNAVLPMMAASLLCKGTTVIHNCPIIDDVRCMMKMLNKLGCHTDLTGHTLTINAENVDKYTLDESVVKEVRASVLFLGGLLGRIGKSGLCYPGGCSIGERPINYHLWAFRKMGAETQVLQEHIICKASKLVGTKIVLEFPSVGATENIILAAVLAEGVTWIRNAAREPEIVDFCCFLRSMGAQIDGEGSEHIFIQGVKTLYPTEYTVSCDRIVMATYGLLVAGTGGHLVLRAEKGKMPEDFKILSRVGCQLKLYDKVVSVKQKRCPRPIYYIKTRPYPGFPTDIQSLLLSVLVKAKGESIIEESIFENRFKTVSELIKLGADIEVVGSRAFIRGVDTLTGNTVLATDLRGGAALALAGLMAEGYTRLENAKYIARGYEDFTGKLQKIGAKIHVLE